MKFHVNVAAAAKAGGRVLVSMCFEEDFSADAGLGAITARSSQTYHGVTRQAAAESFTGKSGQVLVRFADGDLPCDHIVLVGLGARSKFSSTQLKAALLKVFQKTKELKAVDVAIEADALLAGGLDAATIGELIGSYAVMIDYTPLHYKTARGGFKGDTKVKTVRVSGPNGAAAELRKGLINGRAIGEGVTKARDLIITPSNLKTPFYLMECTKQVVAGSGGLITGQYYWGRRLERMGAHALLAVAKGSDQPPVLIELDYTPETGPTEEVLCLVGKSVTFDSGGLDIKPSDGMRYMKRDMSGGAAVLGAIQAIARLKLPISVKVIMAATENMINGSAYKPGDVIDTMAGLSVEIDNTDAEGRLTLADAIEFAKRRGMKNIVDYATLTGAVKMIGGDVGAACFGNQSAFTNMVREAGAGVDELMVEIPMWPLLRESNKTEVADIKNSGGAGAGSTTAAWFLREFAGEEINWVHVDIAGVAYRDRSIGPDPKGATGWGVRTSVAIARAMAARQKS